MSDFSLKKRIEITFKDPSTQDDWRSLEESLDDEAILCKAIGYVVEEYPDRYVMASWQDEQGKVTMTFVIPKGCVVKTRGFK